MTATIFTTVFVTALLLSTVIKLWLARRQLRHVLAHRASVPDAFSAQVDLAAHQKAADYTRAKTQLGMLTAIFEVVLLLAFTLGGGLQLLADWSLVTFSNPLAQGMAMIVSAMVISSVLEIPFSLYSTFVIEARFGFNKMTFRLYLLDAIKGIVLGSILGLPLLLGILWLMERMGDNWWLYVWAVWVSFSLLLLFIYPSFIAPLFNKFKPLEDASLKARIEALLQRCGFTAQGLFVMDGSKRSTHGNAYFTGFGKTKRIVFFDTLIERLSANEIDAVLAHELGHFKRRHVLKRIALTFAVSLGFLWLLAQLMQADWFYAGLGVSTHSTAMALLLFFMVLPVFTFLLQPLGSAYSRKHEFEADAYAAQQTAAGDLVTALVKLYQDNASTLTPDPLYSAFYSSHPPATIRISRLQTL
ncbi:MAG TPA: M48 family metallopeptidase [Gallionellaceae bacterium]|jgi:STE24 endopeptidase|nr:MAG: peptidase M48 [Gallionellales bacterium 24-53-125]OZB08328.1 MAG: peptidase M48 [Gallionellales bacterium 39-52-133]HQS58269.1 M48 family metallopeptidase [Gallionellaceae bacterium]HQS73824.1 M48 family metallopeptidase [Gallionellaceae bacterium]